MDTRISTYLSQLQMVLARLPGETIERMAGVIHQARLDGRTIFVVGNGGSAATASHWANDLCKFTRQDALPHLRALALTDNVPLITAWANDSAYENIFVEQLDVFIQPNDVLIAISGSGNSPNVLNAVRFARTAGATSLGLTGFDGGKLKDLVDLALVVPSNSMQQVEDAHMILAHLISTLLADPVPTHALEPAFRTGSVARSRAILLDRDGVINENRADYVKTWTEFRFIEGAREALARLAATGFKIVVVSNQSGVGRGLVSRETVDEIHRRMVQGIEAAGGRVDRILYCPHRPEEDCTCRKPRPGLLHQAAEELGLDLTRSYLIGDSIEDLRSAWAVGAEPILVKTGRGRETLARLDGWRIQNRTTAEGLREAVDWIESRERAAAGTALAAELPLRAPTVDEVIG